MKKIRVAVNGFGRIGRVFTRVALQNSNIEIVAINDLGDAKTMAHLFKYDSVHGKFEGTISFTSNSLIFDGNSAQLFAEKDVAKLPWSALNIDIVVDCTGIHLDKESLNKHLIAGAKKVILSAPPKDDIKSVVLGINDSILNANDKIISNASCTTNCAAPMIDVLHKNFGIKQASINTVHSYTGDQRLHDSPHKDLRRARAAALSIIPTTTGAAKAITKIFPELVGKIGGSGMRVPVPDGSLTDMSCILEKHATVDEINQAFKAAADTYLKGILEYSNEPLVSIDIVGNSHSCVFDEELTSVVDDNLVRVIGWYDNESGYSNRLVDLVVKFYSIN
ncbi:MAG: type I glyceraldehyde-3-phosphate dehydrogenase [Bacteroidota bacterium]